MCVDEKLVLVSLPSFASGVDTPHLQNTLSYKIKSNKMSPTKTQPIPTGYLIFSVFGNM